MRRHVCALVALLFPLCPLVPLVPLVLNAGEGGVALSPALILISDLTPGQEFSLTAVTGATYDVVNNGAAAVTTEVSSTVPPAYATRGWEPGFEPLPQEYVSLVLGSGRAQTHPLTLAPGAKASLDLRVVLPERADLRNRHFVAFVDVGQTSSAALGASLRLRARVLIETAPAAGVPTGVLGWAPSRIAMTTVAGGWSGAAVVGNQTATAAIIDLLPLSAIYPTSEAEKRARYYSGGVFGNVGEDAWAKPDRASVTLAPGATANVSFIANLPTGTADGAQEVWFAARRAPAGTDAATTRLLNGVAYDRFELVRLRFAKP